jgi:hypothetical protein
MRRPRFGDFTGGNPSFGRLLLAGLAVASSLPAAARAQVSGEELFARVSFLVLIPVGIAQVVVAAKLRSLLPRSRTALTATSAILSVAAGFAAAIGDASPAVMRWLMAALCCVPSLPVALGLVRRKHWPALVATGLPPAIAVVFVLA